MDVIPVDRPQDFAVIGNGMVKFASNTRLQVHLTPQNHPSLNTKGNWN
jgi:hypothetical protein